MDDAHLPPEAAALPGHGPHLLLRCDEMPADFVPLRLLLQPSGTVVEVDRLQMVIGRHTGADIRLPLPDVSRRHCRLQLVGERWQVVDLNSLNGTHVNGEQVQQATLDQDDLLRVGGFTFKVDLPGATVKRARATHVQSILQTLSDLPRSRAG
jgi:pSer/pThr/pTyr-binding forkhead associated (FHA) protein